MYFRCSTVTKEGVFAYANIDEEARKNKKKKIEKEEKRQGKEYFKTTHLLQSALLKASFYKLHLVTVVAVTEGFTLL